MSCKQCPDQCILRNKFILWATFHSQKVPMSFQPLLRNGYKSYRVEHIITNYMAIMSFKVIQGYQFGTNRKFDFLLVINTNLPHILHRFQVMSHYWSNFR